MINTGRASRGRFLIISQLPSTAQTELYVLVQRKALRISCLQGSGIILLFNRYYVNQGENRYLFE